MISGHPFQALPFRDSAIYCVSELSDEIWLKKQPGRLLPAGAGETRGLLPAVGEDWAA